MKKTYILLVSLLISLIIQVSFISCATENINTEVKEGNITKINEHLTLSQHNVKMITQSGKYQGVVESVSECERDIGDKRFCSYLDIRLYSGEIVRSEFYMNVRIVKRNETIYSDRWSDDSKPWVDRVNDLYRIKEKYLMPGTEIRATVFCGGGDAVCYMIEINIIQ